LATPRLGGSHQRPAHLPGGTARLFDIAAELALLRQQPSWQRGDRGARTLVEADRFRLLLTALKPGARVRTHQAPGRASIQTISGQLSILGVGHDRDLLPGQTLVLGPGEPHTVEAVLESSFLLAVVGPTPRQP
jgi:quercetin dioxygenase-like cupin family protein